MYKCNNVCGQEMCVEMSEYNPRSEPILDEDDDGVPQQTRLGQYSRSFTAALCATLASYICTQVSNEPPIM